MKKKQDYFYAHELDDYGVYRNHSSHRIIVKDNINLLNSIVKIFSSYYYVSKREETEYDNFISIDYEIYEVPEYEEIKDKENLGDPIILI